MTPRTWQLLRLLADGEFHSGVALAHQLGVSRATVFAALSSVAEFGVQLQRIRGRGYRLVPVWQQLDAGQVNLALAADAACFQLEILQQATSTNTGLLRRAAQGAVSGSVLAAELQTGGRGRIGRSWHSGLGNALTFSLLWRFNCGLNALSGLSLAVGVAIMRALQRFEVAGAGLKWPNDILSSDGKLGGVLIEAQGDMYGPSCVVIGIGLNCSLPPALSQLITQRASALDRLCPAVPGRNQLLAAILQELAGVLQQFSSSGFACFQEEWQRYHVQQNLPVRLAMPDGSSVNGIALGVSDSGELRLAAAGGVRLFNSGEVGAC
ncbi:MAG TPA: biotin--[acetyl-CoA-carboxylase] ligase [Gallionella sp.]|jgi:BirA family biotin operon repressor/biotin-[acetyl-CoA-carboxylase] ligase|nr:biotin--[acetyl-CoA-carboxylase] ligase [Gallionella sp.]OGS67898.1 MAG: biotin--[acetyl-CoA-carboxylase] ligase [Gallionellales bacterium GWA2_54_124]OGT17985.1 MAG: biotin--[acetyl-CoA-carboxylase] ligase [Gallionellales bacterium RIFOXYD12_FULL_53_10]HCI52973.1 biotin--[acetyl-CoA-carboxylase] ligase [Gallionella sp.]